jgi:thiol-disulfide isomerase/thioredoxin
MDNVPPLSLIDTEMSHKHITASQRNELSALIRAGNPQKQIAKLLKHDVVLFFKASWCPSCRAIDADIKANLSKIPVSLVILDVNYDNSSELKQKYGVTSQHTFVQVDKNGNLLKKWGGSPTLSALVAEVK